MFTNLFPVILENENFEIRRVKYSENLLKSLRKTYNKSHSFFRNNNFIYISHKSGDDINIGEKIAMNVYDNSEIILSLLRHIFFKTFIQKMKDRIPVSFHPFKLLSSKEIDDWVYEILPDRIKGRLAYKKLIEMQFQIIEVADKIQYVCCIDINRKWIFEINCEELVNEGYDIRGKDVIHSEPIEGLDKILAPTEEFVGKVLEVTDAVAIIETSSENVSLPLNELFLKKTTSNIKDYLSFIENETLGESVFNHIKNKRKSDSNLINAWNEVKDIIKVFAFTIPKLEDESIIYSNNEGFSFRLTDKPVTFENSFSLSSPTFIFDKAGVKTTNNNPDRGLSNYGPYDNNVFDKKEPNIISICHKNNRGRFTSFLQQLFEGIPNSTYYKNGLRGKFALHNIANQVHEVPTYTIVEYQKIISKLDGRKPDLVIIELDDSIKLSNHNLYYEIKAKLLTLQIPLQVVLKSKVDGVNEYILNSIALQLYAKLGGIPWVLMSSLSVDREIVIGVSHSVIRENKYSGSKQERYVGITSFFSSDGQYLLSNKAKEVPYDDYFDELLDNLKSSFTQLENTDNWKVGDTIRLIFHIFKPIKNVEFDVVSKLMKSYSNYDIRFAFVTISHIHPYKLLDENILGNKNSNKELVPFRGSNLKLDSQTCLVQMLGNREVKSNYHNASPPILIRIRTPRGTNQSNELDNLLFQDLQYVIQQIYSFTNLSWRNYLPSEHPATLLYSELMTKQLSRLRKIDNWNPDVLNFTLKSKKWFL